MKILHYALGFPPYRTGGLTKFCIDLMIQQNKNGHKVAMMWPGKMGFINHKVSIKDRGTVKIADSSDSIYSFEVLNPLPISYDEGICKFDAFMDDSGKRAYDALLDSYRPDVIHVHTLMGLHRSFLVAAKEKGIRLVFTTHDFFPICPKVTVFRHGKVCSSIESYEECGKCNTTALSMKKIKILQSPLYRKFKDSSIVRKLRKQHRDEYLSESMANEDITPIGTPADYKQLRGYYYSLLQLMDIIHYNSSVAKLVYERHFKLPKSTIIGISHADIVDYRQKKEFSNHIRFTYLGPISGAKGYFVLKKALDRLWKFTRNFELNVYFEPMEPAPYIKSHSRYSYTELGTVMDNTDMVLTPSVWFETFGFTVIEALSYGVPVVISGNVGAKDILVPGAGIIVEDMDAEKLYEVLKKITPEQLEKINKTIVENMDIITLVDMSKEIESKCYM